MKRLKAALKKHEGILTLIGALIVFGTFIVKDTIRERYKEWAESIETAEIHYKLAAELTDTKKEIRELLDEFRFVRKDIYELKRKPKPYHRDAEIFMVELGQREILNASAEIENLSMLITKLPTHEVEDVTLVHLKRDMLLLQGLMQAKDQVNYEENTGEKLNPHDQTDWHKEEEKRDEALRKEKDKDNGLFGGFLLEKLKKDTLVRAVSERDKYESLNSFWKPFSFVLFGLGWGIGLAAKWAGIKEEDAEAYPKADFSLPK
jgi:hypothetical protein